MKSKTPKKAAKPSIVSSSQESQDKPTGNTKKVGTHGDKKAPTIPKNQCILWCFTLKKEENEDASQISQELKVFCSHFNFQLEMGKETGYLHWQIAVRLKQKEYYGTVLNLVPKATHVEATIDGWRGKNYCQKNDTRIEGPYNQDSVFVKVLENLYPWQKQVETLCLEEPDDRTINWYWEPDGCTGKTSFCKYMYVKHKAGIFENGKKADIAFMIKEDIKIALFNLTRTNEDTFNYGALESIKDGLVMSGKYESCIKVFNSPHVFVFANFAPNLKAMSKDRWNVVNIKTITE